MITPNNKFFNQQWGLYLINVPQAWTLLNGGSSSVNGNNNEIAFGDSNIRIAIVDNGIETKNNIPISDSFNGETNNGNPKLIKHIYNDSSGSFDFVDIIRGSHGMGVGGIVSAKAEINSTIYDGKGVVGVAPNCQIFSLINESALFRFIFMFGLAGLEYSANSFSYSEALNKAYNLTTDTISGSPRLYKKRGTIDEGKHLYEFLNNTFADIFNLSLQLTPDSSSKGENFSTIFFNELTFLGRDGRGCVLVVGAGNDGLDIEPSPNQFLNEMASSNKPIIVGAVSVANGYNWITNNPLPHPKKSSYSNFGDRIDVCAPGGGGTTSGQEDNTIFTTTVRGAGQFIENTPLKLTLINKIKAEERTPQDPDYYAYVALEFNNTNGIFAYQNCYTGSFSTVNGYRKYLIHQDPIVSTTNQAILILHNVKKTDYNNLIDSTTGTPATATVFEFSPLFTKITQTFGNKKLLQLESLKGAYAGANIFIGTLGNTSSGKTRKIVSGGIDYTNNQITLTSNINANVGDYVVFPLKSSKVVNMFSNGTKKIVVQDVEGFFIGGSILIKSHSPTNFFSTEGTISSIDIATRTLNFSKPLVFSGTLPPSSVNIYADCIGAGDITPYFNGTSAATPFVSGIAALVLSANKSLSSAEVKHIIKQSASKTLTVLGPGIPGYLPNSDGYQHSTYYGTGLVDAEAAVQLALDWHDPSKYGTTVVKPIMSMADRLDANNNPVFEIPPSDPDQTVSSPDIWVLPDSDTSGSTPTVSQPLNTLDTSVDQKIYIRIRNLGNRQSFKECDVRVFVAFTDDVDPAFSFPDKWYHQDDVKLLGIKEIPIISQNDETILEFEWKDIKSYWDTNNPKPDEGLRKRAYILAHIAPFDGLDTELSLTNVRQNKQLTCKEIIVTHNGVSDRTAFLPGKKLDITVGQELVEKTFDLNLENILETDLATTKIKATKVNRADQSEVSVFFSKNTNDEWEIEGGLIPDWIEFETPDEIASQYAGYTNIKFPHTIIVNNSSEEVKIETINP